MPSEVSRIEMGRAKPNPDGSTTASHEHSLRRSIRRTLGTNASETMNPKKQCYFI